jgi:hypothetical protein
MVYIIDISFFDHEQDLPPVKVGPWARAVSSKQMKDDSKNSQTAIIYEEQCTFYRCWKSVIKNSLTEYGFITNLEWLSNSLNL